MFRSKLVLASITAVFLMCYQAQAMDYTSYWWVCGSGEWGDAGNWNPQMVPDNVVGGPDTYAVYIDPLHFGSTGECNWIDVGLTQNHTIDRLDCSSGYDCEIQIESWGGWNELTLVGLNGLRNFGYLEIEEIEIIGNVRNLDGATLVLCDMDIEGDLYNQQGASIGIEYEVYVDRFEFPPSWGEGGELHNNGTIEIYPMSELYAEGWLYNSGTILIYGGVCGADEGLNNYNLIQGFGVLYAEQLLRNKGQIIAYGGSLAIGIEGTLINTGLLRNEPVASLHIKPSLHTVPAVDVNNNGTIEVNASGGVAFDCDLVNEPNATINLLGGTLAATSITQSADATFQGQGDISTANLIVEADGLIRLNGPTNIFGNVQINPNATLEISDGQTLVKGRTTCNNGTIHMIGGRVICQGGLTNNNCNIIWEPGTYTNIADFNLDGTVNFKDFADFANTWLWQAGSRRKPDPEPLPDPDPKTN